LGRADAPRLAIGKEAFAGFLDRERIPFPVNFELPDAPLRGFPIHKVERAPYGFSR